MHNEILSHRQYSVLLSIVQIPFGSFTNLARVKCWSQLGEFFLVREKSLWCTKPIAKDGWYGRGAFTVRN